MNFLLLFNQRVAHTLVTSYATGMEQGQNVGLKDFCLYWTLLPPGTYVYHKV